MLFPDQCRCVESRAPQVCFHDPVEINTSVESFVEEQVLPANGMRSGPYKFELVAKNDSVLDLSQTTMDIRFKVVGADGAPVPALRTGEGKIALAGNPISSLWRRIEVRINDQVVNVESSRNVSYKGLFEDWLAFRPDERAEVQGVGKKNFVPAHRNRVPVDPTLKLSIMDYKNREDMADGREVQLVGRVPVDFLGANHYLSPRTRVSLTFFRNTDDFTLINHPEGAKIKITDIVMHTRRIAVTSEVRSLVPQRGEDRKEVYHSKFGLVKDYQVPQGALRWNQHVILGDGRLPKFVMVGMVKVNAFTGADNRADPFFFEHFDVNHLSLRAGNQYYPRKPYTPHRVGYKLKDDHQNYKNGGNREYYSLFSQTGKLHHFITPEQFAEGSTVFPFNLTPDLASLNSPVIQLAPRGPMSIEIGFAKPLPQTIALVVYMLYDQTISIEGPTGLPREEQF